MIWHAKDINGDIYRLGDYGDVIAAAEAAVDYIQQDVVAVWTEDKNNDFE